MFLFLFLFLFCFVSFRFVSFRFVLFCFVFSLFLSLFLSLFFSFSFLFLISRLSFFCLDDFPLAWENLLPCLVERSQSLEHIVDVLKVVHSVTKRYRNQFKSSQTLIELKAILEAFQAPFLDIAKKVHQFISEVRSDVDKLVYGFKAMVLISRIFYSLNYVDLPEFFEDHISDWMTIFLSYVEYETTEGLWKTPRFPPKLF